MKRLQTLVALVVGLSLSTAAWAGHGHGGWHGHHGWHNDFSFGFSFPLAFSYNYYDPPPYYYYEPAPVYVQPRVIYRSPPPPPEVQSSATVYSAEPREPSPEVQMLEQARRERGGPPADQAQEPAPDQVESRDAALDVTDIKALTAKGLGDDVIISQIRHSGAEFHLSTDEIIDLKTAGVSEKVITAMIDTAPPVSSRIGEASPR